MPTKIKLNWRAVRGTEPWWPKGFTPRGASVHYWIAEILGVRATLIRDSRSVFRLIHIASDKPSLPEMYTDAEDGMRAFEAFVQNAIEEVIEHE